MLEEQTIAALVAVVALEKRRVEKAPVVWAVEQKMMCKIEVRPVPVGTAMAFAKEMIEAKLVDCCNIRTARVGQAADDAAGFAYELNGSIELNRPFLAV